MGKTLCPNTDAVPAEGLTNFQSAENTLFDTLHGNAVKVGYCISDV